MDFPLDPQVKLVPEGLLQQPSLGSVGHLKLRRVRSIKPKRAWTHSLASPNGGIPNPSFGPTLPRALQSSPRTFFPLSLSIAVLKLRGSQQNPLGALSPGRSE